MAGYDDYVAWLLTRIANANDPKFASWDGQALDANAPATHPEITAPYADIAAYTNGPEAVAAGQQWQLHQKPVPPKQAMNPGQPAGPVYIPPPVNPGVASGDIADAARRAQLAHMYAGLKTKGELDRWLYHQVYLNEQTRDPAMDMLGQGRYDNSVRRQPTEVIPGRWAEPRADMRSLMRAISPGRLYVDQNGRTNGLGYVDASLINRNVAENRLQSFVRGDGNAIQAEAYRAANPQTQLGQVAPTPSAAQRNLGQQAPTDAAPDLGAALLRAMLTTIAGRGGSTATRR